MNEPGSRMTISSPVRLFITLSLTHAYQACIFNVIGGLCEIELFGTFVAD